MRSGVGATDGTEALAYGGRELGFDGWERHWPVRPPYVKPRCNFASYLF